MRIMAMIAALGAAGCVPASERMPEPAPATGESGRCDAAAAQGLVGRAASETLLDEARRLSGAEVARFLRPGQVVTLEYRADRINLRLDARDVVEAVDCG